MQRPERSKANPRTLLARLQWEWWKVFKLREPPPIPTTDDAIRVAKGRIEEYEEFMFLLSNELKKSLRTDEIKTAAQKLIVAIERMDSLISKMPRDQQWETRKIFQGAMEQIYRRREKLIKDFKLPPDEEGPSPVGVPKKPK